MNKVLKKVLSTPQVTSFLAMGVVGNKQSFRVGLKSLFRQLMASLSMISLDSNGRQRKKEEKLEYLENEASSLDYIKTIFHIYLRAIILVKNKIDYDRQMFFSDNDI